MYQSSIEIQGGAEASHSKNEQVGCCVPLGWESMTLTKTLGCPFTYCCRMNTLSVHFKWWAGALTWLMGPPLPLNTGLMLKEYPLSSDKDIKSNRFYIWLLVMNAVTINTKHTSLIYFSFIEFGHAGFTFNFSQFYIIVSVSEILFFQFQHILTWMLPWPESIN